MQPPSRRTCITKVFLLFASLIGLASVCVSIGTAAQALTTATKTYIVTLRREADQDACVKDHKLNRRNTYRHALNGFSADLDDAAVQRLKKDKRVLAVEPNGKVAPCLILSQGVPSGVFRIGVSNFPIAQFTRPDQTLNVDVAVLDSGIDFQADLPNVVQRVGFADPGLNGVDWQGHGTEMAGIIGAVNNNFGLIGVAPGVRLWSVQVIGPTESDWTNALAGLDYIAQHADQISVLNASLGPGPGSVNSPIVAVHSAIQNLVTKGVVVVAGACNSALDIAGSDGVLSTFDTNGSALTVSGDDFIPASLPEAMAVSAMDPVTDVFWTGTPGDGSNFSQTPKTPNYVNSPGKGIDVAAPGVNILSLSLATGSGYATGTGTSAATAHVSGLVALYIAANGRATNAAGVYKIRQAIIDSALPQSQWRTNNTHDPDGNPEPLAMASTNWIPKPNIAKQTRTNGTVQLTLAAVPGNTYVAQYRDALTPPSQWANLPGSVTGFGSAAPATLTDSAPNPSTRFYRLGMSPAPPAMLTTNAAPVASGSKFLNGFGFAIATNQPGIVNGCFRFTNSNLSVPNLLTYVDIPQFSSNSSQMPVLNPNGPFAVEFWAKPAQLVNNLFCPAASLDNTQNSGNSRFGWAFYLTAGNTWQFNLGSTNGFVATLTGGTAQANTWQHIAGVYDGANITLYMNGQLVAGPTAATGFSPNITQPLRLGAASDGTRTFDGWLDEPAVYTSALSATTISAHFNAATTNNAGYGTQILADHPAGYWHFDDH